MKSSFLFVALSLFLPLLCQAQFNENELIEAEAKASGLTSPANPFNILTLGYDIKYHRFEWQVDPAVLAIAGKVTTYFVNNLNGQQSIYFDCANNLVIDSVRYHGANINSDQAMPDLLQVTFPQPLAAGAFDSVAVYYHGVPNGGGFGSFIASTHGANNTPVLWTLSEPYGARDWWPCKQDLNDKIDSIDVFVTTQSQWRVASNGLLVAETANGPEKTFHWKHNYPITAYLVAIGVTDYTVYTDPVPLANGTTMDMLNYVFPEFYPNAPAGSAALIPILQFYDSLFAGYPYANEKYGHCQFGWGGGMEHQTMSFVIHFDRNLLAHELAHQWFGDKVTCASWEDIWLNEGFATYLEGLSHERFDSEQDWYDWKYNKINNITSAPNGSVWVDDTTTVWRIFEGRLSYAKGSYLLHMLRWKLGDQNFFQGLRNYLTAPEHAYGYARTSDLQFYLEQVSGQNLTEFFNDWFYGQGYPTYNTTWWALQNGATVSVAQTTSHPSVSFYEMPLPYYFTDGVHDTTVVLNNTFSGETFNINLSFTPTYCGFDPSLWILSANNTITGIENIANTEGIQLFPNPADDRLQLVLPSIAERNVSVSMTDATGRVVLETTIQQGERQLQWNVGQLAAGSYMVVLNDGLGLKTMRVVVK